MGPLARNTLGTSLDKFGPWITNLSSLINFSSRVSRRIWLSTLHNRHLSSSVYYRTASYEKFGTSLCNISHVYTWQLIFQFISREFNFSYPLKDRFKFSRLTRVLRTLQIPTVFSPLNEIFFLILSWNLPSSDITLQDLWFLVSYSNQSHAWFCIETQPGWFIECNS